MGFIPIRHLKQQDVLLLTMAKVSGCQGAIDRFIYTTKGQSEQYPVSSCEKITSIQGNVIERVSYSICNLLWFLQPDSVDDQFAKMTRMIPLGSWCCRSKRCSMIFMTFHVSRSSLMMIKPSTCLDIQGHQNGKLFHDLLQPGMVSSVGASSPTEADIAAREPGDETSRVLLDGLDPWVSGPLVEIEDDWTYEYHGGYITHMYIYIYCIYIYIYIYHILTYDLLELFNGGYDVYDILWHPMTSYDIPMMNGMWTCKIHPCDAPCLTLHHNHQ